MSIEVKPIETWFERRIFLTFPWRIYNDDPLWMPPLMPQRINRLDPAKNPVISNSVVEPFIAWLDGEPAGTMVLSIDEDRNQKWEEDRAMFGYFDCIEQYAVAEALFDKAVAWTRGHGKSCLWGPWMLDYEDSHGFLIKGWDRPAALMCAHNPQYYPEFAEQYGFEKARRDSLAFVYEIEGRAEIIPPKLTRVVKKLQDRTNVVVRQARLDQWDEEIKMAVDVLNRGLAVLEDSRGFWNEERMEAHARDLKPVLDPAFVLIAEVDSYPVGWVMGLPNLAEPVAAANGLRYLWNYPQFWLALRKQTAGISMKSIAVDPEYWNRGVDALLVYQFAVNAIEQGYTWGDLSLTGEDNPMTPRLATRLGAREYKRYRIYSIDVQA